MKRRNARRALADEAARLMVDEGVKEYITAKHLAADLLFGMRGQGSISLPSNREIRAAIARRDAILSGQEREHRLRRLRRIAWELMGTLEGFQPRLIGSVASGTIHRGSDIDIQVFTQRHDLLEDALVLAGIDAERLEREVFKDGATQLFVHYHLRVRDADIELSVYAPSELGVVRCSSVDGRPIDRMPRGRLGRLLLG